MPSTTCPGIGRTDMSDMQPIDYTILGGSVLLWAYWYWVMR